MFAMQFLWTRTAPNSCQSLQMTSGLALPSSRLPRRSNLWSPSKYDSNSVSAAVDPKKVIDRREATIKEVWFAGSHGGEQTLWNENGFDPAPDDVELWDRDASKTSEAEKCPTKRPTLSLGSLFDGSFVKRRIILTSCGTTRCSMASESSSQRPTRR